MGKPNLKVVDSDPLAGYTPLIISSVELLDAYWLQIEELLAPVVDDAMHGEMDLDDIYQGVKTGQMYCIVFKDDSSELPDVALAMVLDLVVHPKKTILNVTAIGGRQLDVFQSRFWKDIRGWAYMNGVREMQAMVSPAMARIIGKYGFEQVYHVMRLPLTEI